MVSILGSCGILIIDFEEYLSDVLMEAKRRLKDKEKDFEDLSPLRWQHEREQVRDESTKA